MSVIGKIASILKKVPGFRSGHPLGTISACFMYVFFYVMLTINDGVTTGDKFIITAQKCFIFFVPYVLFLDIFGVQQKLPFFKNKKVGYVISFCIAVLCAAASLNITPKIMSSAYKEKVRLRLEVFQKEKEARDALQKDTLE